MTSLSKGINAVLRVPGVTLSRASLEATTGPLSRFEKPQSDATSYAQICPFGVQRNMTFGNGLDVWNDRD